MRRSSPNWIIALLVVTCFTLGTMLQPRVEKWDTRTQPGGLMTLLLGDGRRILANHFFVKADVYFHSGYYPSWMDQGMVTADTGHLMEEHPDGHAEAEHEKAMNFLGEPRDWIDRFGRNFYPCTHSHLEKPSEAREILPWLRLSADMDPQRIETYTMGGFWLRRKLGKVDEAEQFLREGLRANPGNSEILLELGKLYDDDRHDPAHARNLWELALRRWQEQAEAKNKPDDSLRLDLLIHLAHLEEEQGNLRQALHYRELESGLTPQLEVVKKEIEGLKNRLAAQPEANTQIPEKPPEK